MWLSGPNSGLDYTYSAATRINNYNDWWISGGQDSGYYSSDQSVLYDGNSFGPYENLESNDYGHHLITINETHVVFLASYQYYANGIYNINSGTWSNFPRIPDVCFIHFTHIQYSSTLPVK